MSNSISEESNTIMLLNASVKSEVRMSGNTWKQIHHNLLQDLRLHGKSPHCVIDQICSFISQCSEVLSIKPKICYVWDKSETKSSVWVHVCVLIISVHTMQWLSKQQQHEVCSTDIIKSTGSVCLHFDWPVCCFLVDIMSYWSKSRVLCWPSTGAQWIYSIK